MDWRVIPGFEKYEVNRVGDIRRCGAGRAPLRPCVDRDGYLSVTLRREGRSCTMKVHRAVCLAFVGPQPDGRPYVAHWDGKPSNNTVDNLRWASAAENTNDKRRHGRWNSGERQGHAKLTDDAVRAIKSEFCGRRGQLTEFAAIYGVDINTIRMVTLNRTWRHINEDSVP